MEAFICAVYERYNSIIDIDKNYKKIKFNKLKYNPNDFIAFGIEDFNYLVGTHAWNEYVYSEIISKFKIKSIKVLNSKSFIDTSDFKEVYKRLSISKHSFKDKIYFYLMNYLSIYNKNINFFIFDTYLNILDEIKLNLKLNKKFFLFKPLKFHHILSYIKKRKFSELRKHSSKKKIKNFDTFIKDFILINLPKTYLESFKEVEDLVNNFNLPSNPKVIFTARGINRSTLIDRYIASKLLNKSKLFIAQHGGNYGQHKGHWGSKHEIKISNKFLSWENKKSKSKVPLGIIKNINNIDYNKKNKMILFESRNRLLYSHEFKVDQGAINSNVYFKKINKFLSYIKEKELLENLVIKNNPKNFGYDEKKIFMGANKNIKFVDHKLKTLDLMKKSKLIIYSFPSTGHLECISANVPMLMFYFNDLDLMERETKSYFKKFIDIGILHTEPKTLYKKLLEVNAQPNKWWYSNKIQKVVNKYADRFSKKNSKLIEDLSRIIINQ